MVVIRSLVLTAVTHLRRVNTALIAVATFCDVGFLTTMLDMQCCFVLTVDRLLSCVCRAKEWLSYPIVCFYGFCVLDVQFYFMFVCVCFFFGAKALIIRLRQTKLH